MPEVPAWLVLLIAVWLIASGLAGLGLARWLRWLR